MAKVVSINISEKKGTVKTPVTKCTLVEEHGIEGDAHAGKWHRQVSLLANESIEKAKALGLTLDFGSFAENITTEGICLYELPVGTKLKIGETVHEVSQIGKVCHDMCAIGKAIGDCVMPKEGIFTKVIKGGEIKIDDIIEIM